jgi:outer membrane protein OmpA-like peptidoglycan-associated protein
MTTPMHQAPTAFFPAAAWSRRSAWLVLALLAACTGGGVVSPGAGGPSVDQQRYRLARELAGTPVTVEAADEGYRVAVPLKYAFDPKRSAVKAPLAAVLDRVANGVRANSGAEIRVAAPSDGRGGALLARDRAESTRDYLIARGVPRERFTTVGASAHGAEVEILVSERGATAVR